MKKETTKQIMVNVSDEAKATINELKETLELTDKEFITIALQVFAAAKDEDIQTLVKKLTIEKQTSKIEAKLARIQTKLEKVQGELESVGSEEPEEVLYSASDEEVAVEA